MAGRQEQSSIDIQAFLEAGIIREPDGRQHTPITAEEIAAVAAATAAKEARKDNPLTSQPGGWMISGLKRAMKIPPLKEIQKKHGIKPVTPPTSIKP
jgi:hypothetical protein